MQRCSQAMGVRRRAGSRPKKAMKVIRKINKTTVAMVAMVPILSDMCPRGPPKASRPPLSFEGQRLWKLSTWGLLELDVP